MRKFFNLRNLPAIISLVALLYSLPATIYLAQQQTRYRGKAAGNTYYVPDNFNSIQAAVNAAQPGDTIYVRSGTYNESVNFSTSGQEGNPITLTNHGNETVTINGGGSPAIVDNNGTEYWIIEGFTLDSNAERTILFDAWGCSGTCRGSHHWIIRDNYIIGAVRIYGSYNVFEGNEVDGSQHKGSEDGVWELYDASHHNIYRNNHVHHFNSRGIWSMHRTHDCIFEGNHVHHINGTAYPMGIDTDGYGNVEWRHTIRRNLIHDCGHNGIEMENTFDSIVENNIVYNCGGCGGIQVINYTECESGGGYGGNDCIGMNTNNIVRQNLVYNSGKGWGSINLIDAGGVKIWGNTIYGSPSHGVVLVNHEGTATCPNNEVRGNIIYESGGYAIYTQGNTLAAEDHNLSSDPHFVDPANHDFRLQADSPAIDAGIDIGLTTDFDGNPRPQGAGYDIGAYEYGGAVPPSPTPSPSPSPSPPIVPTPSPSPRPSLSPSPSPSPSPFPSPSPTPPCSYKVCQGTSCVTKEKMPPCPPDSCSKDSDCTCTYKVCERNTCVNKIQAPPCPPDGCTSDNDCAVPLTNLTFRISLQGIAQQKQNKTVRVTLKQDDQEKYRFKSVGISADQNGVYTGGATNIEPGIYDVYIKGWAHLQRKLSDINLQSGENSFDWSGPETLTGDATGDNKINIQDFRVLVEDYLTSDSPADFNLDGVVNIQDFRFIAENYLKEGEK